MPGRTLVACGRLRRRTAPPARSDADEPVSGASHHRAARALNRAPSAMARRSRSTRPGQRPPCRRLGFLGRGSPRRRREPGLSSHAEGSEAGSAGLTTVTRVAPSIRRIASSPARGWPTVRPPVTGRPPVIVYPLEAERGALAPEPGSSREERLNQWMPPARIELATPSLGIPPDTYRDLPGRRNHAGSRGGNLLWATPSR